MQIQGLSNFATAHSVKPQRQAEPESKLNQLVQRFLPNLEEENVTPLRGRATTISGESKFPRPTGISR